MTLVLVAVQVQDGESVPKVLLQGRHIMDTICSPDTRYDLFDWRQYASAISALFPRQPWLDQAYRTVLHDEFPHLLSFTQFLQQQQVQSTNNNVFLQGYRYAFQTPNTSLSVLTTPTSLLFLLILVFLMHRIKLFLFPKFSSWGRRAGRAAHGSEWELKPENQVRISKFGEYTFRLCYHSVISIFGICLWLQQVERSSAFASWRDLFRFTCDGYPFQTVSPGMTFYYLVQSAYNLEAILSLLQLSFTIDIKRFSIRWAATVRGDFREMVIHHCIANALIMGSSHFRYTRMGSMVFILHDVCDVLVDMSKLANFVKWKITTMACFGLMVSSWFVCRLILLPFWILGSLVYQIDRACQEGDISRFLYVKYGGPFVILVGLIIMLHLAWFIMFLQIAHLMISKRETHDLSEHKRGEQDEKINNEKQTLEQMNNSTTTRSPPVHQNLLRPTTSSFVSSSSCSILSSHRGKIKSN